MTAIHLCSWHLSAAVLICSVQPMDLDPIQTRLKRIFEQRQEEGLKQDDLEAATGIPQSTISRTFKHGWRKKGPSLLMFLRLLGGLGVMPSEFFRQVESGGASAPSETVQVPELFQLRDRLRRLTRACDAFEASFSPRPGRRLRRSAKRR